MALAIFSASSNWVHSRLVESFFRALLLVFRIGLEGTIFLIPGLAFACWVGKRCRLDSVRFIALVLVTSAIVGYVSFWPYLLGAHLGATTARVIFAIAITAVLYYAHRQAIDKAQCRSLLICIACTMAVTTFCSAVGFLYRRSDVPGTQAELRFVWPLPDDNVLPYRLTDDLYNSKPFRPFLVSDWKSSDRPPLQTAIVLLQRPLWSEEQSGLYYQILATFLQSLWVASLWLMLQTLRVDRKTVAVTVGFCIFSGFFVLNTFFVWPKLLAAAFFVIALVVLRFPEGKTAYCTRTDTIIGGAAIALAMLSHGGVAFSVVALAIVMLASGQVPKLRSSAWGILVVCLLLLPWGAYQKWYDPPGDRLLKWHLAGVINRDSRTFYEALLDAYTKVPLSKIASNKVENVRMLFGPAPWNDLREARSTRSSESKRLLRWYKAGVFFFFFQTIGVLNLGFAAFLHARVCSRELKKLRLILSLQRLLSLSGVSLAVWCLLMYIPGSTVVHAGSFGTELLLFAALTISLITVSPYLTYVLLGFQALFLFPLFALTDAFRRLRPAESVTSKADLGMACLMTVSLMSLLWLVRIPTKFEVGDIEPDCSRTP